MRADDEPLRDVTHDGRALRRALHDVHDRRRRRLLDDARRREALVRRRARLERGAPEVAGGDTRCNEQAEPQRIE
jgi:hypothetical protein